jgi:predicted TPR repeat methyltransferase
LWPDDDPLSDAQAALANGEPGRAADILESMHAKGRGGLLLQILRAGALSACGRNDEALAVAREATRTHPNAAPAALALGDALRASGFLPAAIAEYHRAQRLDPGLDAARFALGCAWLEAGESEHAADAFAQLDPAGDHPGLGDRLAEIERMRARQRSDPRYVRHLFDQFSQDYDARMRGNLSYRAPEILRALADMLGLSLTAHRRILDLGCGTGLGGMAFADMAATLDGVDLSPAMIEKARARGIYHGLFVNDIEAALAAGGPDYDLLLAADTLVYLGDLSTVFRHAARRLSPGGVFLFTVERCDGEGFALGPKRRWRHSESYLRSQADAFGFAVAGLLECEPRSEAGVAVPGYAVAFELQRTGAPTR